MIGRICLRLTYVATMAALQACAALPSAGPATSTIETTPPATAQDFVIVPLNTQNIGVFGPVTTRSVQDILGGASGSPARSVIDIGDKLAVSIWEPSSDGLFSTVENKETQINVTVDQSKSIFIPYAGRIEVGGLSVEELRSAITNRLEGRAIDPQVQVALIDRDSRNLTVVGDVAAPGQFDVPPKGLRLIEAIALANGTSAPSFESEVVIVRGTTNASIRMDDVLHNSANNIWLRPRDTIQVKHKPRSFTAFGAVTSQNLLPFQTERVTLAEALAQSGGLNDSLADAGGVFVFRLEDAARLDQTGTQIPQGTFAQGIPTIYQLDFSRPNAFFMARAFLMRDKDIIYVANAPVTDLRKFTNTILSPLLGATQTIDILGN